MHVFDDLYLFGSFDKRINVAFISLILKCSSPMNLNDFRPIYLVGCIYKIVSKVLANQLRVVLEKVVGANQFSFVKEKQMLDCSLVANEVIDKIKKKGT